MPTVIAIYIFFNCLGDIDFVSAQYRTNFVLENLTFCPSPGPVKYSGYFTTENNKQYLEFDIQSPIPLDENIGSIFTIKSVINKHTNVPLFQIRERNFCKALNKYVGEFWYGIERAAGILPGVCPIPPGHYHVHRYYMDYKRITLQTFPFGTLKIVFHGLDKRKNQTVFCLIILVENVYN